MMGVPETQTPVNDSTVNKDQTSQQGVGRISRLTVINAHATVRVIWSEEQMLAVYRKHRKGASPGTKI